VVRRYRIAIYTLAVGRLAFTGLPMIFYSPGSRRAQGDVRRGEDRGRRPFAMMLRSHAQHRPVTAV